MEKKFEDFIVSDHTKTLDALIKINNNKQGFVIVIDECEKVVGVLTDGDVRRSIIKEQSLCDNISSIFTRDAVTVSIRDGFEAVMESFKKQSIKFIPIVDDQCKLVNIITKGQMHALLLQDIQADLSYDFFSLDTNVVDHEIYLRPWGYYKTTVLNDYFQTKIISVKPQGQLSLQSHNHREEHWIVAHGEGLVQLDKSIINVRCGSIIFIPLGCKHIITNISDNESLIITEVQIGDYFGEDDIIRYEDIYGRC